MTALRTDIPMDLAELAAASPERVQAILSSPAYWQALVQGTAAEALALGDDHRSAAAWGPDATPVLSPVERAAAHAEVTRDGHTGIAGFLTPERSRSLAAASLALLRHGWPATFMLMFDDAWHLSRHLARAMQATVNDEVVLRYEMFVYCVDSTIPAARARGIQAHRDAPGAGHDAREGQLHPRHCTAWLALTDTDVHNGCIYVVPASQESAASKAGPIREEEGIPLEVSAGTLLMWGGHVAHWGGIHDPARAKGPRLAVTCVASVEPTWGLPPLPVSTAIGSAELPDLATRLSFIAALMHGFGPAPDGSAIADILAKLPPVPALAA